MNFSFSKLEECYDGTCDYKNGDCIQAAAKFLEQELDYEYSSKMEAFRHIIKEGGMEAALEKHGYQKVRPLFYQRGDVVLRGKITIGIYTGGRMVRFVNGYFPLEKSDRLFRKEGK